MTNVTTANPGSDTTIKRPSTFGRPDLRPVRAWEAWVSLGVGLLMTILGGLQLLVASSWNVDPAVGFTQLLVGTAFLALAGLQVSRPASENRQLVAIYRTASFALSLPLVFGVGVIVAPWIG